MPKRTDIHTVMIIHALSIAVGTVQQQVPTPEYNSNS